MIAKILKNISIALGTDHGEQYYRKYLELTQHEGWQIHQGLILEIANGMAKYMLSKEFTRLDEKEKDAQQRAMFISKEVIDFLLDPLKGLKQHKVIQFHNKRMEEKIERKSQRNKK